MTTLTDYQFSYGGVVLDGAEASGATYRLISFKGLERQTKGKDVDRPEAHGAVFGNDYIKPRTFTFEVLVKSANPSALSQDIEALNAAWTPLRDSEADLEFKMPGWAQRKVVGRPRRFQVSADRWGKSYSKAALEFACSKPFMYALEALTVNIDPATATLGGLTFTVGDYATDNHPGETGMSGYTSTGNPFTTGDYATDNHPGEVGLDFQTDSTGGEAVAVNSGTFDADWTAQFVGPLTNPTMTHQGLNQSITMVTNLAAGQVLEVSSLDNTVTVNGVNRYSWLNKAEWFKLAPGSNSIKFTTLSTSDSGSVRLSWTDTYL